VVDPRATPTALGSAVHLQPVPGTDLGLANGLLLADLDTQIDAMIDDGTYLTLYRKYSTHPVAADLLQERPKLADKVAGTDLAPQG
jgi:hypothetical protein